MKFSSVKTRLIIFLGLLALYLSVKDKDAAFLITSGLAVISALGADTAVGFLKNKEFALSESSVISALIIGFVLSSDQPLWMFALASAAAVLSKHLIRVNGRHIFNPAAAGIFLSIILFKTETQWKGTYLWYILLPAGLYFTYKIRKLEVIVGYGTMALLLFGIQAIMQKTPLLSIFGYLSYFYIFVMLIEPKTTPAKPVGKLAFGSLVAILIFILTESAVKFDAELCALLALNLFVPLLNRIPERRPA